MNANSLINVRPMKTLLIYLDAFPWRFRSLLLRSLRKVGLHFEARSLLPVLGYTDCFKVTFLSGLFPCEHGFWVSYVFDEGMDFPFLSIVDMLPGLIGRGIRFVFNSFLYPVHNVPSVALKYIRYLDVRPESSFVDVDLALRRAGVLTLFKFFEDHGVRYISLEDRFFKHRLSPFFAMCLNKLSDFDVLLLYIDEPDFWGHRFGTRSVVYRCSLKWLSDVVSSFVSSAFRRGFVPVIFSDHGMADVSRYINVLPSLLRDRNFGRSYVVGVDATMVRFKYLSDEGVRDSAWLRYIIKPYARRLTSDDYVKYHLPRSRMYGDEVWLLREGVCFFPNYFSWLRPRGMHAYDPFLPSQHGIVVAPKELLESYVNGFSVVDLHNLIKSITVG